MQRRMMTASTWTALAVALVLPGAVAVHAQNNAADTERLVQHLLLRPGMSVAEIGAGNGELTVAIAKVVGPSGHVYSNELDGNRLGVIRTAVQRAGLSNVTVVEGRPLETNLPAACCDAIFMRNVYHHFAEPGPMNTSLWRSLKPGGRAVIIDFGPRGGREAVTAGGRAGGRSHGVSADSVVKELTLAGFEIVTTEAERGDRWFLVVGRKP
jgi:ubiquinone/menaquinone biosynthesis C-methylase UbiE